MASTRINLPSPAQLTTASTQKQALDLINTYLETIQRGYLAIGIAQGANGENIMDSVQLGTIRAGSKVEYNGTTYEENRDIGISTANAVTDKQNYVYFNGKGYAVSDAIPNWDCSKCGWYNTDKGRAVIKVYVTTGQYNGKVILDSYSAMQRVNQAQPIPTVGGTLINPNPPARTVQHISGIAGWVLRFRIKGGKGGNGGGSVTYSGGSGDGQGKGVAGQALEWEGMRSTKDTNWRPTSTSNSLSYVIGGDGNDGGDSVDPDTDDPDGSAGAASGGATIVNTEEGAMGTTAHVEFALGGSGAGGDAGGSALDDIAGGGGGGFGEAGSGASAPYSGGKDSNGGCPGGDDRWLADRAAPDHTGNFAGSYSDDGKPSVGAYGGDGFPQSKISPQYYLYNMPTGTVFDVSANGGDVIYPNGGDNIWARGGKGTKEGATDGYCQIYRHW